MLINVEINRRIISWWRKYGRSFPWRDEKVNPYAILITEMLLRKTRAEAVAAVVPQLLKKYPTAYDLADADQENVYQIVRCLGFGCIRSKALIAVARDLVQKYSGNVPDDYNALVGLPHVGRYIANAVLCFAFNKRVGLVDANIARLFSRLFNLPIPNELHKDEQIWKLSMELAPNRGTKEYFWGLLDLGAMICKVKTPECTQCPLLDFCPWGRKLERKLEG